MSLNREPRITAIFTKDGLSSVSVDALIHEEEQTLDQLCAILIPGLVKLDKEIREALECSNIGSTGS